MLKNLPLLAHDETLYSWSGIAHAWNGLGAISTSVKLFSSRHAAFLHDFPSHLSDLERNTEGSLGPARLLALRHTLLGYFLPLAGTGLAEEILKRTCATSMPDLKMRLGITASRIGGHHPFKGCLECFDEDESTSGFAYWHLAHQYPSVMVCEKHQRPLTIAWDSVTPVHRRGWLLPRSGIAREWIPVPLANDQQIDRLLRLATFSRRFGLLDPSSLDPVHLATSYQVALRGLGLVTARGSLRLPALVSLTRSRYRGLEAVPGFETLQAVTSDWPGLAAALTRKCPRPGHPFKHLLLIAMLFESWDDFWTTYCTSSDSDGSPPRAERAAPKAAPRCTLAALLSKGLSIRAASAQIGVTTTTGVKWAKQLDFPFTPRAKTFTAEKQGRARQMLKNGQDIGNVSARLTISRQTVRRMLAADRHLAETWVNTRLLAHRGKARSRFNLIVQRNPQLTTKALRRVPNNCYMWLYRHDRAWLCHHLPKAHHQTSSSRSKGQSR
ncbi:TnsD family Tn7-like transposition protein [Dyella jiangningensis]